MAGNLKNWITCSLPAFLLVFLLLPDSCLAQFSVPGTPVFQKRISTNSRLFLSQPDLTKVTAEDAENDRAGYPYRFAVNRPVDIDLINTGKWEYLENGRIFYTHIRSEGAKAIGLYFSEFMLAEGCLLFIYTPDHQHILGAFTHLNNQDDGMFATSLVPGSELILELYEPNEVRNNSVVVLSEVCHAYRGFREKGFGSSGPCEVNINCPEGDSWQDEKRGVVRIQVKISSSAFWCTGSLMNNARQNFAPYLLTADHCGMTANATDLSQWIFYFNYESASCPDPSGEPPHKTLVGAKKKAATGGGGMVTASDMYLVLLNNPVPDAYNPYFNGWSLSQQPAGSGVCIHHPEGDIKKISVFTSPAYSTNWGAIPNTHWGVGWVATQSGHGVTEPGSSGSPLFNSSGLIVGQLSGGGSSCTALNEDDFFGKLSYSWQPPGSDSSNSLKYWLDPDNSGITVLPGMNPNVIYVNANFTASEDTLVVGRTVDFTDLSTGGPTAWKWNFEGAENSTSSAQHPQQIRYPKPGVFKVSLIVGNGQTSDTLEKPLYITVIPNIYPNPHSESLHIDLGSPVDEGFSVELFDETGREIYFTTTTLIDKQHYLLAIPGKSSGYVYMKFKTGNLELKKKLVRVSRHP